MFVADHFQHYLDIDTIPKNFDHLFLCYNRKPTWHRVELYKAFKKNNLLNKGVFTLGNEDPEQVKLVNADEKTIPLSNEDDHGRMGIANDTMTLGNINLWNSHFVTIVNETQHISKLGYPFLSEKMWKPIIGMRPFLCLGDHGTIKLLQDAGFYTFNDMFDLAKKDLGVNDIVYAIKNCKFDLASMYKEIQWKLHHNKKRFFEFAKEQKQIFDL